MAGTKPKNKGGRPPKFKSVEDMQEKIEAYFDSCYEEVWVQDEEGQWRPVLDRNGNTVVKQTKPFTVTGLAIALDTDRQTIINYSEKEEFFDTIKNAKQRILEQLESGLYSGKLNTPGTIFSLKNNYGWVDKTEVRNEHEGEIKITLDGPAADWSK